MAPDPAPRAVEPKVAHATGGAGLGALLLQIILTAFRLHPAVILDDLLRLLASAIPALAAGYRAPHQHRRPPPPASTTTTPEV